MHQLLHVVVLVPEAWDHEEPQWGDPLLPAAPGNPQKQALEGDSSQWWSKPLSEGTYISLWLSGGLRGQDSKIWGVKLCGIIWSFFLYGLSNFSSSNDLCNFRVEMSLLDHTSSRWLAVLIAQTDPQKSSRADGPGTREKDPIHAEGNNKVAEGQLQPNSTTQGKSWRLLGSEEGLRLLLHIWQSSSCTAVINVSISRKDLFHREGVGVGVGSGLVTMCLSNFCWFPNLLYKKQWGGGRGGVGKKEKNFAVSLAGLISPQIYLPLPTYTEGSSLTKCKVPVRFFP